MEGRDTAGDGISLGTIRAGIVIGGGGIIAGRPCVCC